MQKKTHNDSCTSTHNFHKALTNNKMVKQTASPSTKRVRFSETSQIFLGDLDDCSSERFYTMEYLREHLENELRALALTSKDDLEDSNRLTWRGLEGFSDKDAGHRKIRIEAHSAFVVAEYKLQQSQGIANPEEELRIASKESSRADRNKGSSKGAADAKEQGHKPTLRGIKKTLSNISSTFKVSLKRATSAGSTSSDTKQRFAHAA